MDPIESYELPQSVLLRVSKSVIPQGTQINSEAKTALSKSTLVFINYLTTAYSLLTSAMENMKMSSRKSMNSSDVFKALETLELDQSILTPVKEAVTSYLENQKVKRNEYRKRKKEEKIASVAVGAADGANGTAEGLSVEEQEALDQEMDEHIDQEMDQEMALEEASLLETHPSETQ